MVDVTALAHGAGAAALVWFGVYFTNRVYLLFKGLLT